jgi:hypothetical protein
MSPEELNRKVEFLIEYQAEFAGRQQRDHEMLVSGFDRLTRNVDALTRDVADLRQGTAQFQTFAAELIAIQSNRLDRQDRFQEVVIRQVLHLLNLILDRLPPAPEQEAT